jgi:hypothetical protein
MLSQQQLIYNFFIFVVHTVTHVSCFRETRCQILENKMFYLWKHIARVYTYT